MISEEFRLSETEYLANCAVLSSARMWIEQSALGHILRGEIALLPRRAKHHVALLDMHLKPFEEDRLLAAGHQPEAICPFKGQSHQYPI